MAPLSRALDRLIGLLTVTDTTLAEFQSSATLLLFGVIFLDPWPTLAAMPVYSSMLRVMPETAWGLVCMALGAGQTSANLLRSGPWRRRIAFVNSIFFGFIAVLLTIAGGDVPGASGPYFGVPTRPVIPCLLVSSFVQALVYLRLALRGKRVARAAALA